MFLAQQNNTAEVNEYDFEKVENAAKWKGLFINSLKKVWNTENSFAYFVLYLNIFLFLFLWSYIVKNKTNKQK